MAARKKAPSPKPKAVRAATRKVVNARARGTAPRDAGFLDQVTEQLKSDALGKVLPWVVFGWFLLK